MFGKAALLIFLILLIGTIYQQISQKIEKKNSPPPGKLIKVGKEKMHIFARGEGTPTIIFSCGNGMFSYGNFFKSFTELSTKTRVVLYDRFGYGWSEKTSRSRTIEQINRDLFELLKKSGEKPPYLLVGHSFGATELFQFAQRYPELVEGLIMLDGGSPGFYRGRKDLVGKSIPAYLIMNFLRITGIFRLLLKFKPWDGINPGKVERIERMMIYNKSAHWNSFQQVLALSEIKELDNNLEDIPLLVLTAEKNIGIGEGFRESQAELLSYSNYSKQKILEGTDHFFPLKNPDLVTREIKGFLEAREKKVLKG